MKVSEERKTPKDLKGRKAEILDWWRLATNKTYMKHRKVSSELRKQDTPEQKMAIIWIVWPNNFHKNLDEKSLEVSMKTSH